MEYSYVKYDTVYDMMEKCMMIYMMYMMMMIYMMYICADIVPRRLILLEIHCYTCVQSFYLLENKLGYFRLTKELENNSLYSYLESNDILS